MVETTLVGRRFGKYDIRAEIKRGGMGAIYLGYDPLLERQVAIKVLAPHLARSNESIERFLREARAAARLDHPNIVTIHDVGQDEENYYFVMAYLVGQDLEEYIHGYGPLPATDAISILSQIAQALDYAHRSELVHRDVKPSNVVIRDDGHATLTDFGIALARQDPRLTATGAVVGTPDYMSPEQAQGLEPDSQSDLYSLGVVAYQMLSGQVPFQADSTLALMYKIVHESPVSMRAVRPDLPETVEQVLGKMLAKDPRDRYVTAEAFVEALRSALKGMPAKGALPDLTRTARRSSPTKVKPLAEGPQPALNRDTARAVPLSKQSGPMPWLWVISGIGATTIVVLVLLLLAGTRLPFKVGLWPRTSTLRATPSGTPNATHTPTPTAIGVSGFVHPSGAFRIAYPSTWRPVATSDAGSLSHAFERQDGFGNVQVWVIIAETVEAAVQLVEKQANRFDKEPQYVLLRDSQPASDTLLREAGYTDPQRGDLHLMLMARAQGRAVGLAVFIVAEKSWAEYAAVADRVLNSFTFTEPITPTVTITPTLTPTQTPTPRPVRSPTSAVTCSGDRIWNGSECVCPSDKPNWLGGQCLPGGGGDGPKPDPTRD